MTSPRQARSLGWAYAAGVLAAGLLLSLAELQRYLEGSGKQPWEPFLWELSSVLVMGLLGPLIYRWHVAGLARPGRLRLCAHHLLGAAAYTLAHVAGMFGLRYAVYAMVGQGYRPGSAGQILAYEAGKDMVSYAFITGICHGLYVMVAMRRREQELLQVRAELAEARLTRLAEQIQPHFLFNTLNLISSVMYEDVARADRILCDLAALLRQALNAQENGRHTLAQELSLVEPYLNIMRARFGERLSVQIEASEEARRCLLPSLLLIAPVENAITHDVAQSSGPVRVSVGAEVQGGELLLTVRNSGVAAQREHRDGAIGMSNTRARLSSVYGARAQVQLQADAAGGSCLSLRLPAELS